MAREQSVFLLRAIGRIRFSKVLLSISTPIRQEGLQAISMGGDLAELFAEAGPGTDAATLLGQPGTEVFDERGTSFSAYCKSFGNHPVIDRSLSAMQASPAGQWAKQIYHPQGTYRS